MSRVRNTGTYEKTSCCTGIEQEQTQHTFTQNRMHKKNINIIGNPAIGRY